MSAELQPQLAGAEDEPGVGVADTVANSRTRPACRCGCRCREALRPAGVALPLKGDVTHAFVMLRANVVEVLDVLLFRELPQHIDVRFAIASFVKM